MESDVLWQGHVCWWGVAPLGGTAGVSRCPHSPTPTPTGPERDTGPRLSMVSHRGARRWLPSPPERLVFASPTPPFPQSGIPRDEPVPSLCFQERNERSQQP